MVKSASTENTTKIPGNSTAKKAPVAKSSKPTPSKRKSKKTGGLNIPLADNATMDDETLTRQEPDDTSLVQAGSEWNEIVVEDPLEILEDPSIAL